MKRLKKFWQENSVLLVLFLILIACLIAIGIVVFTYFVGDSHSKYGDRLEGIEEHPFDKSMQEDIINKLKEEEVISDVKIDVSGKSIYITITYTPKTTLVEAQSKAIDSLDIIDEDVINFYDIEYLIEAEDTESTEGFKMMGSHNVSGTGGIVWNNNTVFKESEEKE